MVGCMDVALVSMNGQSTDDALPDVVRISTLHYITSDQRPERPPAWPLISLWTNPHAFAMIRAKYFCFKKELVRLCPMTSGHFVN